MMRNKTPAIGIRVAKYTWIWGLLFLLITSNAWGQTGSPARMIPQTDMAIPAGGAVSVENASPTGYLAANAIDGNPRTFWQTEFGPPSIPTSCTVAPYCFITIRLARNYTTNKLVYRPALATLAGGADQPVGRVGEYHVLVTTDDTCSTGWTEVATGTWADTTDTKRAVWNPVDTRCVKLENRLSAHTPTTQHMHAAEIYLFEAAAPVADSPTAAQDADFQARCTAAGVTACYGFDTAFVGANADHVKDNAGVDHGVNLRKSGAGTGTQMPTRDTTYKTSGSGSLRFTAPPPPHDGADIAGQFLLDRTNEGIAGPPIATVLQSYGPNETFYIQFRYRKSNEAQFNSWGIAMKHMVLYGGTVPCDTNTPGLVLVNYTNSDLLIGYSRCGGDAWSTNTDLETWKNTVPYYQQQGQQDCQYGFWNNCLYDRPDVWRTYYCKFGIATFGSTGHTVECWYAEQGAAAWTKFINLQNAFPLGTAISPSGFDAASFEMYMTGLTTGVGDAGVMSTVNIDELIVSSQPIALPLPAAPGVNIPGFGQYK